MTIMDHPPGGRAARPSRAARRASGRRSALTRHQRKDGTVVDVELISHELELDGRRARLVLATDISDRDPDAGRAAAEPGSSSARRSGSTRVGRLAGGVAHDFNNLLTTIRGFSDLLLAPVPRGRPRRADVEQIRKAADRGVAAHQAAPGLRPAAAPAARGCWICTRSSARWRAGPPAPRRGFRVELKLRAWCRHASHGSGPSGAGAGQHHPQRARRDARGRRAHDRDRRATGQQACARAGGSVRAPTSCSRFGTPERGWTGRHAPPLRALPGRRRAAAALGSGPLDRVRHRAAERRRGAGFQRAGAGHQRQGLPAAGGDRRPSAPRSPELPRACETVLVVEDEDGVRELVRRCWTDQGHTVLAARAWPGRAACSRSATSVRSTCW